MRLNDLQATRSPFLIGLRCLRCQAHVADLDQPEGCSACSAKGQASSFACVYEGMPREGAVAQPYRSPISMGEGNTPLVTLPSQAHGAGRVYLKLESANPTGSHKDRMAALGATHARATGRRGLLAASSGNAGLAAAAYAAFAGLDCEVMITAQCPPLYRALMQEHGAKLVECATSAERWHRLAARSAEDESLLSLTNYVIPAVGSPAIMVEGYKNITAEIVASLALNAPTPLRIYVPVARGDLLFGLALGFSQLLGSGALATMPQLVAVEPFPRLSAVAAGQDYRALFDGTTQQFSTSGNTVTWQSIEALRITQGRAVVIDDAQAFAARAALARLGFSVELCAAAAYAACCDDIAKSEESPISIVIATAHGSRDAALFHSL